MKSTTPKPTDADQVTAHIQRLAPDLQPVVEAIRRSILGIDPMIAEQIKWNNPCFYYAGEMTPFNPKEYRREIAVMNLFKGRIMLVFPSGAKVTQATGLLEGDYKDGRRTVVFKDLDDFRAKEDQLQAAIREWLTLVEE